MSQSIDHIASAWPALPAPRGIPLTVLPAHACAYLPGRAATNRAFACARLSPELYHDLMDAGFRRSGNVFYQPICGGCRECQPIRVPVERFVMSKSQRRVWRRNVDLHIEVSRELKATEEKF